MSKKRVYEFAKENNISSKELMAKAETAGIEYSSHMTTMTDEEVDKMTKILSGQGQKEEQPKKTVPNKNNNQGQQGKKTSQTNQKTSNPYSRNKRTNRRRKGPKAAPVPMALPEVLVYTDGDTVAEIASKLHRSPSEIIKHLFMMGIVATQNQSLDKETIEMIALQYELETEEKVVIDEADFDHYFEDAANEDEENLEKRPPVVTIMGHVDHGKTTLLDYLRQAQVAEGEAGGITQHIGAYQIESNGELITFLDTPGHAAFSTMRARGADITDIAIIVVAADDGVMPQTVEAINHAKAAGVPIIIAVNKIDKPTANPDRVMQELTEHGLIPEAWGGDTIFVNISAKFGQNIEELLEMVLLVAEVEELKANPNRLALGSVIEARLDAQKGSVSTVLVQQGTLKIGDPIVVGNRYGRVRAMINDKGQRIKAAGPSTPVEITGLNEAPQAGDHLVAFADERKARQIGERRASQDLQERRTRSSAVSLENLFDTLKEGELKSVNIIIKADVRGSAEALGASLKKIEVEGVKVDIIHQAVGAINESDISLAVAANAIVIGFNVRATSQAAKQAELDGVDIRTHNVIYNAIDEVETAMKGLLDPEYEEEVTGHLVVRETYEVSKVGTIAGSYVSDGFIQRSSSVRVIRDNIVIHDGELSSLKRFQDDVREVKTGFECGLMIEGFNDIKVDDQIEAYRMVEIKR